MAIHTGKQNIPCICVTNRTLCRDDFLTRIDHIAKKGVADAILLREKDLTEREYLELAEKVLSICKAHNRRCILHTYYKAAKELGCKEIHLPLPPFAENAGRGREAMVYHGGNVGSFVKTGKFSDASAGGLYDGRSHF